MSESLEEQLSPLSSLKVQLSDFEKIMMIGSGAYSEVYLANYRPTNYQVALKILTAKNLEGTAKTYFIREIMILASCDNPFLINLLGYTDTYPYCIATPYIGQGSLYDALKKKPSSPILDNTDKTIIAMCIAYGMISLHSMSIIHRDLKSLNILLDDNCLPRIIDFGISRFHGEESELVTVTIGTPHWMAPEMFNSSHYDNKVDVYSFGILLWEMITGSTPFEGMTAFQIMNAVCQNNQRPPISDDVPEGLRNLMKACWEQNPADRPTFEEVFNEFASLKAYFADTDLERVSNMVKFIKQNQGSKIEQKDSQKCKSEDSETKSRESSRSESRRHHERRKEHRYKKNTSEYYTLSNDESSSYASEQSEKKRRAGKSARKKIMTTDDIFKKNDRLYESLSFVSPEFITQPGSYAPSAFESVYDSYSTKSEPILLDAIEYPSTPMYTQLLKSIVQQIDVSQAEEFFYLIIKAIKQEIPDQIRLFIYQQISNLLHTNLYFLPYFIQTNCLLYFQCASNLFISPILSILLQLARNKPISIPVNYVNQLMKFTNGQEKKFICILSTLQGNFSNHQNFPIIVQIYVSNFNNFLYSSEAMSYLNVLYTIFMMQPNLLFISQVFMKALHIDNDEIITFAYSVLCSLPFNYKQLPMEIIVSHFDRFPKEATSIIARIPSIPNSTRLVRGLLKAVKTQPLALYLLCKITIPIKGALIFLDNTEWLLPNKIECNSQLKIFLSIFYHQELRERLIKLPNLIDMFKRVLTDCPLDSIQAVVTTIRRISVQFPEFIQLLSQSGFLNLFIQEAFIQPNQEMAKCGLLLFDNLGRNAYVDDYLDLIPYFPTLLQMDQQVQIPALCTMIVFTIHKQTIPVFEEYNLPEIVEKLKQTPKNAQYQQDFIERFKK